MGFPRGSAVKNLPAVQETQVQSLGQEDPQEEGVAAHSSILPWRIPMDRQVTRVDKNYRISGNNKKKQAWAATSLFKEI